MLTKAITATTGQKSAAFQVTASVTGSSNDPQVKPFLDKPIKLDISGKGGANAIDISGKANVAGQDYQMGIRADDQEELHPVHEHVVRPGQGHHGHDVEHRDRSRPSSSRRC